ncbi:MAG: MFS transporter [Chloroflexota bacterium]
MQKLQVGLQDYISKLRLFSVNARLILIVSFITGLALGGWRLLFNFYALSLGEQYNESFLGTLQTLQSLAAIIMAIPIAYLAGRYAHKKLLLIVSIIIGSAMLGSVLLPFRASLIIFRMLFGVGFAAQQVVVAPFLMANTSDDERQWVFSFNLGLTMTATFIGNTIGGSLPSVYAGIFDVGVTDTLAYQWAIGTLAILVLAGMIPLLLLRPTKDAVDVRETPWHLIKAYGMTLLPFLLPNLVVGLGAGLMQPFMNLYFRSVYNQTDFVIGLVFAFGGFAMAVAQFIAPPMADRLGKINAVILTQAISIPFLLTLGIGAFVVPSGYGSVGIWFPTAVFAFMVRLALMNMGNPIYQTFMLEGVPTKVSALAVSLSSISFQFGWFVMPQVSGYLQVEYGEYGFVPIFGGVALFYAIAVVMEMIFFKNERKRRFVTEAS